MELHQRNLTVDRLIKIDNTFSVQMVDESFPTTLGKSQSVLWIMLLNAKLVLILSFFVFTIKLNYFCDLLNDPKNNYLLKV